MVSEARRDGAYGTDARLLVAENSLSNAVPMHSSDNRIVQPGR